MSATTIFNNAFLCIIGIVLSAYSIYVEHKVHQHDQYDGPDGGEEFQALCDIELIGASCSAVFSLPEGKMMSYFGIVPEGHALDVPNGVLGMLFYTYSYIRYFNKKRSPTAIAVLFTPSINAIICTLAIASSVFLARKLFILRELCVVCVSTHIINTTLMIRAILELSSTGKTTKTR
mmetsp:Transcript_34965/g.64281  ORF Transcript_34965/g.64281 Transcript_34965/m.64281 type:complete len:177 (-) Transcript_34965:325-855(-)|eukprot:CAMPEP_0201637842 /NCGR_PEP_ID=MMETSP0493-20130528/14501_1 /ASSEMBLY_ACC=CAM_ASM_000838 /TAXON_ID=420259 /ORGANISM="Thalassiosira gravida, Strain GMp14c1" /LENGTH=176 /DNA_ID=CAMNT_0048110619 /DNA_START=60 /DNA_END=590 /DNA_ORIENTATION=+